MRERERERRGAYTVMSPVGNVAGLGIEPGTSVS